MADEPILTVFSVSLCLCGEVPANEFQTRPVRARRGDRADSWKLLYKIPASRNAFRAVVLNGIAAISSAENQRNSGPGARAVAVRRVKV